MGHKGFGAPLILLGILFLSVMAGGYFYLNKSRPPISITTPLPTPVTSWITFTSNEYGFSFRYPPNYTVKQSTQFSNNPRSLKLFSAKIENQNLRRGGGYSHPNIEVVVFKNDTGSLSAWIEKYTTSLPFDNPSVSKPDSLFVYRGVTGRKDTLLGGKLAVTFQSSSFESSPNPTLTRFGNYVVSVVFDNENEEKDPQLKLLYPQILSTFKFLQPNITPQHQATTDLKEKAKQAMINYLQSYKSPSAGEKQIADYRIESINSATKTSKGLEFYVVFSIKPMGPLSEIVGTNNGVTGPDGWIINKSGSVLAVKEGSVYKIQGIATGMGIPQ